MSPTRAWVVAGVGGVLLGYALALRPHGDPVLGGLLALVSTLAVYGTIRFPDHLRGSPLLDGGRTWQYLAVIVAVLVMALSQASPVLAPAAGSPVVVTYLGAVWLGGVTVGIALERGADGDAG